VGYISLGPAPPGPVRPGLETGMAALAALLLLGTLGTAVTSVSTSQAQALQSGQEVELGSTD
jgi:hypothetical protein